MKKGIATSTILIGILLIALAIGGIFATGLIKFEAITGECRNIYCDDYEFICCGEIESDSAIAAPVVVWGQKFTCEHEKCKITILDPYITTVAIDASIFRLDQVLPYIMSRGQQLTTRSASGNIYYYPIDLRLSWCGPSACPAGVTGIPVAGADGCRFVTADNIYDPSGRLIREVKEGEVSYTVPKKQCYLAKTDRHVCGDTCEYCNVDADCSIGHTYRVPSGVSTKYAGYGAECQTGFLTVYGCRDYGIEPTAEELDQLPREPSETYKFGTRCEEIDRVRIQCCPYAGMCGADAVCDPETFTCKMPEVVKCRADWECGVGEFYDRETKQIRKYVCEAPGTPQSKCTYKVIKTVECYYNEECPTGWFCDVDNTCKEMTQPKSECPTACCVDDPRYFDKPCPPDEPVCCPGGVMCAATKEKCEAQPLGCAEEGEAPMTGKPCCEGYFVKKVAGIIPGTETFVCTKGIPEFEIPWVIIFTLLAGGTISLFVYRRYREDRGFAIGVSILSFAVITILLYFVLNWLFTWWWLIALGGIGILILIILFGGGIMGAIALLRTGKK